MNCPNCSDTGYNQALDSCFRCDANRENRQNDHLLFLSRKGEAKQLAKCVVSLVKKKKEIKQLEEDVYFLEKNVGFDYARLILKGKIFKLADALQKAQDNLATFNEFAPEDDAKI